ncbi:E3 ubiquitin-protein ligase ATL23, partial [Linum perenne]
LGRRRVHGHALKPAAGIVLSSSELDKLHKVTEKELVMGKECAICLDEIEAEDPARMIPVCNHGYHLECTDQWLSKHPFCPVFRRKIDLTQFLNPNGDQDDSPC